MKGRRRLLVVDDRQQLEAEEKVVFEVVFEKEIKKRDGSEVSPVAFVSLLSYFSCSSLTLLEKQQVKM